MSTAVATNSYLKPQATIKKATMDSDEDWNKRMSFLSDFVVSLREHTHTDIQLKPNDGPAVPAHKALLAARSAVFKNLLESDGDGIKAPPSSADTLTLSELNTEALNSFLEFLYTGTLPFDKWGKHTLALYAAAHKYEIPYLQERCQQCMLKLMNTSNVVSIFKFSDAHSNNKVKDIALKFIVANRRAVVSTKEYEDFTCKNPLLSLEITRAITFTGNAIEYTSCYNYIRDNIAAIHSNHLLYRNQPQPHQPQHQN